MARGNNFLIRHITIYPHLIEAMSAVGGNVPRCLCIYIVWSVAPYQFVVLSFQASAPTRLALDSNDQDRSSMGTLVHPHLQSRIIGAR